MGRFLLVAVAVLQVCVIGETWWWTVATMVVGAFALEALRAQDRGECGAGGEDHANEGERPDGAQ